LVGFVPLVGMTVLGAWLRWWLAAGPVAPVWPALIGISLMLIYRLLAEWQRRTTLVELARLAPGGTVIVQGRGAGGPPVWIQVGWEPRRWGSVLVWKRW
jgi:hypothetical protein